jgi:hypothetical protein
MISGRGYGRAEARRSEGGVWPEKSEPRGERATVSRPEAGATLLRPGVPVGMKRLGCGVQSGMGLPVCGCAMARRADGRV